MEEKAPQLKIKIIKTKVRQLFLALTVDKETRKVEVYVDGILITPVITPEFGKITLDIGALNPGLHEVTVCAYDRFLNRAVAKGKLEVK